MKKIAFAFASLIIMLSLVVVHAARDVVVPDKNVNQVLPVYTVPSAEQIEVACMEQTPFDYIYSYSSLPGFDANSELISYPLLFRYAIITDEEPVFMEPPGNSNEFGSDIYTVSVLHQLCTDNRPLSRPIKQC